MSLHARSAVDPRKARAPRIDSGLKSSGFSLMEVLIAMLVLSVGLLGLAALQTQGLRFNNEAYYRTQATQLAYQVIDLMRADRDNINAYLNTSAELDDLTATVECVETSVAADVQLSCWLARVRRVLPSGTASLITNANSTGDQIYVDVTVSWLDRELSTSTLEATKSQARCEARPNRAWDAAAGLIGDAGICRVNQVWTVFP